MKIKCLIVDDEALARKLLENYIDKIPELELIAKCENALQAQSVLLEKGIDLMFLDISMPELSGIDLLKSLKNKPLSILTTAHSEYALEGYQLEVTDYLLKPIAFERFFQAASKAIEYLQVKNASFHQANLPLADAAKNYFFVKADYKIIKMLYDEIKYIEGLREYVRIHTPTQKIITLQSMNKLMENLPQSKFFRIHRSYIINIDKIKEIQGNAVVIDKEVLTISKSQKEDFFKLINQLGMF